MPARGVFQGCFLASEDPATLSADSDDLFVHLKVLALLQWFQQFLKARFVKSL
jgi:hypothetical protein